MLKKLQLPALLFVFFFCFASSSWVQAEEPSSAAPSPSAPIFGEEGYSGSFEKAQPRWDFQLRAAFNAFPQKSALGDSYQLMLEYTLPFHKIGDFSLGVHLGSFPIQVNEANLPYPVYENYMLGAQARYGLRWMRTQLIVPVVGVDFDYYSIKQVYVDNSTGKLTGTMVGGSFGLMLCLDALEAKVARDTYESLGIVHTYLVSELKNMNVQNSLFNLSGNLWYWGLRFEFE